jgi:hypothetical protein
MEAGDNFTTSGFIICTLHQILRWGNQGQWDGRMHVARMGDEKCIQILFENMKGRDHWADLGVYGRIVLTQILMTWGSRGSSGSMVSDYRLDDRAIEVQSPTGADFSSSPCVQTDSGAHPASYPVGTGGSFPGGKARPGRDADHSPPSSGRG